MKKSIAKANGLKSTFKLNDNEYWMTSFGHGNIAVPEKDIVNKEVEDLKDTFVATVKHENLAVIHGVAGDVDVALPKTTQNRLDAKDTIEKMYFGKSYSDNIHIQIAYNIMDMKKIFGVYSNNIVYCINNLVEAKAGGDSVGVFFTGNTYNGAKTAYNLIQSGLFPNKNMYMNMDVWHDKSIDILKDFKKHIYKRNYKTKMNNAQKILLCLKEDYGISEYKHLTNGARDFSVLKNIKRANYFSDILCDEKGVFSDRRAFSILTLLGNIRHESFHEIESSAEWMYNLDKNLNREQKQTIDEIVCQKINKINRDFIKNSTMNLNILFKIYCPYESNSKIISQYYDFSVKKVYKNLGFSVVTLRESMLENQNELFNLKDKEYDSVRSKLYTLFDFVLYKYFLSNQIKIDDFVKKLRTCADNSDEYKKQLYINEANKVWEDIKNNIINCVIPEVNLIKNGKAEKSSGLKQKIEREITVKANNSFVLPEQLSYFAKVVYVVSAFLDGKEINMFLDSLINELENIASFNDVLKSLNMPLEYKDNFKFFINAREEAEKLRFVRSVAKMNKTKVAVKNSRETVKSKRYYDACCVLGENNEQKINEAFGLGNEYSKAKFDHTFRNFIINNVINSNRFNYVMRFMNPKNARKIMECRPLVLFAFKDVPESQIERYCSSVGIAFDKDTPDYGDMRAKLTDKLLDVKFDNFSKVSNNANQAKEKERLKALVGLYLSVLYRIVKSIVRINTSYTIAFGIYERDCAILNKKIDDLNEKNNHSNKKNDKKKHYELGSNPLGITNDFRAKNTDNNIPIEKTKINKRVEKLLQKAIDDKETCLCVDRTYKEYRNVIAHLNVVSSFPKYLKDVKKVESYFDFYHYMVLEALYEKNETVLKRGLKESESPVLNKNAMAMYKRMKEHQTACKDFIYTVNAPFAYNVARYINLSCKSKFEQGYGK